MAMKQAWVTTDEERDGCGVADIGGGGGKSGGKCWREWPGR